MSEGKVVRSYQNQKKPRENLENRKKFFLEGGVVTKISWESGSRRGSEARVRGVKSKSIENAPGGLKNFDETFPLH